MLTDNSTEFFSEFSKAFCSYLIKKILMMAANHWQTNGKAGSFDKIIVARLLHYVMVYQREGDIDL